MKKEQFLKIRVESVGTQSQCADLLGMSIRAILRYEKGESEIPWPVSTIMQMVDNDPSIIDQIKKLSKLD